MFYEHVECIPVSFKVIKKHRKRISVARGAFLRVSIARDFREDIRDSYIYTNMGKELEKKNRNCGAE